MAETEPLTMANSGAEATAQPSWLATRVAHRALRWSTWPGRKFAGAWHRKEGRRRGGLPFTVRTSDGVQLAAWRSPANPQSPAVRSGEPRLPVVMLHGWLEVKECHFRAAWRLNDAGHDVILFDHRAHGNSTGTHATFGISERHDLSAVIDEAQQRFGIQTQLITAGYSMGAATVLQHAPMDERVAAVIAMAPFVDFDRAIRSFRTKLAPWMGERWILSGFERAIGDLGFTTAQASTLEAMQRIEVPVLLIEGGRDVNLPPDIHVRPLEQAKTRGLLETMCINDATHGSICRRYWPELDEAIRAFCARVSSTHADR